MRWTDAQRAVLGETHRDVVVFAGPGSGKTTVLIGHIQATLMDGVKAPSCLVVTYTREAARELKQRLQGFGVGAHDQAALRVGTLHAQLFRWLLAAKYPVRIVMSEREQRAGIVDVLDSVGVPRSEASTWGERLAKMRAEGQSPVGRLERRVLNLYEQWKRRRQRWDFEDIVETFVEKVSSGQNGVPWDISHMWVDEFQDIDGLQWRALTSMRERYQTHLFAVGDDDQAIYGFRGGSPHWLLYLPRCYPNASVHILGMNFRSAVRIVDAANRLIAHARERMPKAIQTAATEDGLCDVYPWLDDDAEGSGVARLTGQVVTRHPNRSVAVLARTRYQLARAWMQADPVVRERVEFRTFHEAKGREWDTVHVIGLVDGNPHLRDPYPDPEEERRLVYVAMTRARYALYLHVPKRMMGVRVHPSKFVEESGLM